MNAALEEAKRLDEMLSNYRPQSEWSLLNKTAGQQPFRASKELFDLLEACNDTRRRATVPSTSASVR